MDRFKYLRDIERWGPKPWDDYIVGHDCPNTFAYYRLDHLYAEATGQDIAFHGLRERDSYRRKIIAHLERG